jgi:hypothetical protein
MHETLGLIGRHLAAQLTSDAKGIRKNWRVSTILKVRSIRLSFLCRRAYDLLSRRDKGDSEATDTPDEDPLHTTVRRTEECAHAHPIRTLQHVHRRHDLALQLAKTLALHTLAALSRT